MMALVSALARSCPLCVSQSPSARRFGTHGRIELDAGRLGDGLDDLLPLLGPDPLGLLLDPPELPLAVGLCDPGLLFLGDLLHPGRPDLGLLALPLPGVLLDPPLPLLDHRLPLEQHLPLLGQFGRQSGQGGRLGRERCGLGAAASSSRAESVERGREGAGEPGQVRPEQSRRARLQDLARRGAGEAGRAGRVGLKVPVGELDRLSSVVEGQVELAPPARLHDKLFHPRSGPARVGRRGVLVFGAKAGELDDARQLEAVVDLSELLEQPGEDDLLQRVDVALRVGIGGEALEDRLDLLGDGERVKVDLEDAIEVSDVL